jgi:GT2 family glycosyltransferase
MMDWDHKETRVVDHVIGAFFLIRRGVFWSVGGFDERFFLYLEDLDLSLRLRQAGYSAVFLAEARAFHEGGGTSSTVKATRLYYSLHSRLQYAFKHFTALGALIVLLSTLLVEPCTRIVLALARASWADAVNTIRGYLMLARELPRTLTAMGSER